MIDAKELCLTNQMTKPGSHLDEKYGQYFKHDVLSAMDEYARQEAIEFGEFIYECCYKMPDGRFIIIPQFDRNTDTPDYSLLELYEKYLESKTRKKEK